MRRIHVVAFKMAPKYQKELVQVFRGVYTVTDPFGTGMVPKTGPDREQIDGTVNRSHVNKRPIRHDFWIGTIWNRSRVNIA